MSNGRLSTGYHYSTLCRLLCFIFSQNRLQYTFSAKYLLPSDPLPIASFLAIAISLIVCWFMPWQHLSPYQDGYQFVILGTHGEFLVLHHWDTMLPVLRPDFPLSHIILILS